jgi:hypothetical protein
MRQKIGERLSQGDTEMFFLLRRPPCQQIKRHVEERTLFTRHEIVGERQRTNFKIFGFTIPVEAATA